MSEKKHQFGVKIFFIYNFILYICFIKKYFMSDKPYVINQELEMTFTQDRDCCSNEDQFITIRTQNGGGGDFFVLETQRWAFDCIEDLVRILYQFKNKHDKIEIKEQ